jgi:hypothetical protein
MASPTIPDGQYKVRPPVGDINILVQKFPATDGFAMIPANGVITIRNHAPGYVSHTHGTYEGINLLVQNHLVEPLFGRLVAVKRRPVTRRRNTRRRNTRRRH